VQCHKVPIKRLAGLALEPLPFQGDGAPPEITLSIRHFRVGLPIGQGVLPVAGGGLRVPAHGD